MERRPSICRLITDEENRRFQKGLPLGQTMRKVLALSFVVLLLASSLPTVSACETEAARIANGQLPSPTGISPNKDDSIRETVRIAGIGQEVARGQLWMVLMGANMTERQIADEIDRAMIENGSNPNWPSFETIVASGANGAIPHGDPENAGAGPKQVMIGDIVVVDLGARVNDWVSDITRTYAVGGTENETIIKAYNAIYDAQNLTFPLIEAGTPAWALDDIARTHIENEGFGEYFIHSLGHGFGVCVHEPPLLSSGTDDPLFGLSYNQQPLAIYDAITIEPGIYMEGWFGIRIEDDFLVNQQDHEHMSATIPRDLDWFMIHEDAYNASEFPGVEDNTANLPSDSSLLPAPVGIIEILTLFGLAAWRKLMGEDDIEIV
jgi:methionine aminopeptidase